MYIFLCKNRNRYLLILEEFHGQTTVIFEKIGHFARFWLGNSFGASFPVICPWKTTKIDRNMKNKRAYHFIFQYFNFYFSSSFFAFEPCMYSSTDLVNQILLDGLADWAVQAGRNQINQIFVKYPRFSSRKFIILTIKTWKKIFWLNN